MRKSEGHAKVETEKEASQTRDYWVAVQFGSRARPVKPEIPSASLRAGSSLRLKNGSAQDDNQSASVWITGSIQRQAYVIFR